MAYGLTEFCADCRAALREDAGPAGREAVRTALERLIVDDGFLAQQFGDDAADGMVEIFRDPELGFVVLAYNMDAPRVSPPHDHGRSWAAYGQVAAHTDMTVWQRADDAGDAGHAGHAKLTVAKEYRLNPGQAGLYQPGDIHSIDYPAGARFVRITGTDMAVETRQIFDPATDSVRVVEHVGTGDKS